MVALATFGIFPEAVSSLKASRVMSKGVRILPPAGVSRLLTGFQVDFRGVLEVFTGFFQVWRPGSKSDRPADYESSWQRRAHLVPPWSSKPMPEAST